MNAPAVGENNDDSKKLKGGGKKGESTSIHVRSPPFLAVVAPHFFHGCLRLVFI